MAKINYKNTSIEIEPDQSVLDALLNAGHDIPNACHAGACQSCKMQAQDGQIPSQAQAGLSQAEKTLGYFLSCVCKPTTNLTLVDTQDTAKTESEVLDIHQLSDQVIRLRLSPSFEFFAGQYFTIWHHNKHPRSYSIASTMDDGYIECHIKLIKNGVFSEFARNELKVGDKLSLQGPMGNCIYAPNTPPEQPLLLAGIGTGLAPLYGIIKSALAHGHTGPIHLICAAKTTQGLYLTQTLAHLQKEFTNIQISYVVQSTPQKNIPNNNNITVIEDDIYQYCKREHPSTKGYGIYLCGAQSFVNKLKKQSFLLGANRQDIHADAFLACS